MAADKLCGARLETLEARYLLSVGDLNLPFGGGDGRIRNAPPVVGGFMTNVAAQPDGKFVVGGYAVHKGRGWLERLNAKGNVDRSFGTDGVVATSTLPNDDNAPIYFGQVSSFARQPDGKFLVLLSNGTSGSIWRYTGDGKRDMAFAGGAIKTDGSLLIICALPNGKCVAAGDTELFEFNSDGTPDTAFNGTGSLNLPEALPTLKSIYFSQIVAQKDNKLLLRVDYYRGDYTKYAGVVRLTTAGKLDASFAQSGLLEAIGGDSEYFYSVGIALQSNGHIVFAAEDGNDEAYLLAFKSDGSTVPGFHDNGYIAFSSTTDDVFSGLTVYGSDQIAFFGAAPKAIGQSVGRNFDVMGFTSNGVQSFNKTVDFSWVDNQFDDIPAAATMTADGNILVAGNNGNYGFPDENQIDIASLQGRPGGQSDRIRVVFNDQKITINGTAKADNISIFSDSYSDPVFIEFNGNRIINYDYSGALIVNGGDGNDRIQNSTQIPATLNGQSGNDTLVGGSAADTFQGGRGNDTADYSQRGANLSLSLDNVANDGAAGENDNIMSDVETILGGSGNDKIVGDPFANLLKGEAGNDTIYGGAGNDTLDGGLGHDSLFGQDNDDVLLAQDGQTDFLDGGSGNDKAQRDNSASVKDTVLNIESFI